MSFFRLNIKGLKCDNEECNYKDMSILASNYGDYVDSKCPDCGSVLLTKKDYETVLKLQAIENSFIVRFLNYISDKLFPSTKETVVKADMNGSGKISLKDKKQNNY
tara:strand:- start:34997 stop:35314 length:318 start_codon:yes stop_codon:yes gene_type:complete